MRFSSVAATIDGVQVKTLVANLRYSGRADLALFELDSQTRTHALFTQSLCSAAPVIVARRNLAQAEPRALLINAGNANAATGTQGEQNTIESCQRVATAIDIDQQQVLPFSTGVIGEQLNMSAFSPAITELAMQPCGDWQMAAEAIMTTDTVAKQCSVKLEIDGIELTVSGIAKGSGMIYPNMATMLAFVATDAPLAKQVFEQFLTKACAASFNRISVDGDTSTNDAVTLSATAAANLPMIESTESEQAQLIYRAVEQVMVYLARAIIYDAEGATKFVEVNVQGASTEQDAKAVANSIANSPLVKTALFASDPNWGRLIMAIGKAPLSALDMAALDVSINELAIIRDGQPCAQYTEAQGQREFTKDEITIGVNLGAGDAEYHLWTSDLSHEYVSINADYRS